MAKTNFMDLLEQVKSLKPAQQRQLRALLDLLLGSAGPTTTEEAFEQEMVQRGELEVAERDVDLAAYRNWKPVDVQGKPVSETIIEERG